MCQDRVAATPADTTGPVTQAGSGRHGPRASPDLAAESRRPAIRTATPGKSPAGADSEAIMTIFLSLVTTR